MRDLGLSYRLYQAYIAGEKARRQGKPKSACPHNHDDMRLRHGWLAGWNDTDIALGDTPPCSNPHITPNT